MGTVDAMTYPAFHDEAVNIGQVIVKIYRGGFHAKTLTGVDVTNQIHLATVTGM